VNILRQAEGREIFHRLLEWDKGQEASESDTPSQN